MHNKYSRLNGRFYVFWLLEEFTALSIMCCSPPAQKFRMDLPLPGPVMPLLRYYYYAESQSPIVTDRLAWSVGLSVGLSQS